MLYNLQSYLALALINLNFAFADTTSYKSNVWSQSQDGVGALISLSNGASTENGFKATVYSFSWSSFWDFGYIGASYTTNGIVTTIDSVSDPNFSFPEDTTFASNGYSIYGHSNVPLDVKLIEFKGYFSRKCFFFNI